MIVIDDKIISDDIQEKMFVCHIEKCKGACCVQGDGGAPLTQEEIDLLPKIYEHVKPYMSEEGIKEVEKHGFTNQEKGENYLATPLRPSDSACVYVNFDEDGTTYCGIEKAYLAGKISFKKPISCHLYPIRITEHKDFHAINFHEWDICSPACSLGESLGVPVYQFLEEPLVRKYGQEFYETLDATIAHIHNQEND